MWSANRWAIAAVSTALYLLAAAPLRAAPIPVTDDNYVEADVDVSFASVYKDVGANTFRHDRTLIPLDKQPAVTMNRDTVYSFGIFHVPKGTTITLPKSKDDRYQSAMILQQDHYIDQVFYGPGTFTIDSQTEFAGIVVRTQVKASDPNDIQYVNALQDQIVVQWPKGTKARAYQPREWDMAGLNAVRAKYQEEAKALPNLNDTSGAHGTLDPRMQKLGVSVGLGLLPPEHAVYFLRDYGLKGDTCYVATYPKPGFKEKGFFSFTMYGADKYIKEEASTLNDRTIRYNPDGTFTLHYGSAEKCGEVPNRLNTPGDDWFLAMRVYRPVADVVSGKFELPVPQPVSSTAR